MTALDRAPEFFDRQAETRSPEERAAHLGTRLRELLGEVHRTTPAVRRMFDQAGVDPASVREVGDLYRLPLTRRDDLKARQQAEPPFGGFLGGAPEDIHRIYVLAGALLVPGPRVWPGRNMAEAMIAAGLRSGDRVINSFNYHYWSYAHMLDAAVSMIGAVSLPLGGGNAGLLVNLMRILRPEGFLGTPSYLMNLTQRAESMDVSSKDDLGLKVAFVGAEMLPEKMRGRLTRKTGAVIRQNYSIAEIGCLGYECHAQAGLHVPSDIIIEVVHPDTGRPVEPGAVGEVVATAFNPLFPLVRFATGDLSSFMAEPCACGRTSPRLRGVMGRTDQATKVKGTFIHPWQLDEMMRAFPEVLAYQVVITRPQELDELMLYVELKSAIQPSPLIIGRLEKALQEGLALKGRAEIVPRGNIPEWAKKIDDRRQWDA